MNNEPMPHGCLSIEAAAQLLGISQNQVRKILHELHWLEKKDGQYHLMPLHALEQVNLVLMHGAKKYGEHNWQKVEGWQHRYYNAALRHIFAWQSGTATDPETNISHLAHAICSLMFLIEIEFQNEVIGLLLNEIEKDEQDEK